MAPQRIPIPLTRVFALALLSLVISGCSLEKKSTFPPALGKPLFSFEAASISRLVVHKNDPTSGDRWSAGFIQEQNSTWRIEQPPEGTTPTDRLANTGIINHFLDTLKSLRPSKHLNLDHPQNASQWGLEPPVFWIKLEGTPTPLELRIGAKSNPFSNYAETAGHYLEVEGAALKMLEYLSEYKKLRHHKLMTWKLDDADRVRFQWHLGSPPLQIKFERNTGEWIRTDSTALRQRLSPEALQTLEGLPHLEIEKFDLNVPFGRPWLTVEWKSRKDQTLTLEIDSELKARASDRPGAVFQLHPDAKKTLAPRRFTH